MASELPRRQSRVGVDRAEASAALLVRAPGEFEVLEPLDDPVLERVLEGLEGTSAARARAGVRSA